MSDERMNDLFALSCIGIFRGLQLPEQRNESSQVLRSEERIAENNSKTKLKY